MNRAVEVGLDDQDRILIPAELQGRLGLSPGMTLIVEKGDSDGVRLSPSSETPKLVEKEGVLVVRAEPLSNLAKFTRQERDRRVIVSP